MENNNSVSTIGQVYTFERKKKEKMKKKNYTFETTIFVIKKREKW